MTQKPHRTLLDRVSGYADEAAAYARRRRQQRKPFARVYLLGQRSSTYGAEAEGGRAMFVAAAQLLELAGPLRRARRPRQSARRSEEEDES